MNREIKKKDSKVKKAAPRRSSKKNNTANFWRGTALVLLGIFIFSQFFSINIQPKFEFLNLPFLKQKASSEDSSALGDKVEVSALQKEVVPPEGFELPISWGDFGPVLLDIGVIDLSKFEETRITDEQREILTKGSKDAITITQENSRFVVNMLWALGLAQKSKVYEEGPMGKEYKDRAANFASTGGWTLGKLAATSYLGGFQIVDLSDEQQDKVAGIAKNVYRPCCGNNTWFPDCNHGMAALGAIELMVAKGLSEDEIYQNLLVLNSYWFPSTYVELATYFKEQGKDWSQVDAKLVLGQEYSSAQGYQATRQKIKSLPQPQQGGGSCGV